MGRDWYMPPQSLLSALFSLSLRIDFEHSFPPLDAYGFHQLPTSDLHCVVL